MTKSRKGVATSKGQLPAEVAGLAEGLERSKATAAEGHLYMRFTKFGEWVYGTDDTEAEEASVWAINPKGFGHGWICWGAQDSDKEGQKLDEIMVPSAEPMPARPENIEDGVWTEQRAMQMVCVDGEDKGTQVLYQTNSYGGLKAYNSVITGVVTQLKSGVMEVVPLATLESDSYVHKKYGKIFTPEIVLDAWTTLDATEVAPADDEEDDEPVPEEKPKRRTRTRQRG